jgi:hypothetical protein
LSKLSIIFFSTLAVKQNEHNCKRDLIYEGSDKVRGNLEKGWDCGQYEILWIIVDNTKKTKRSNNTEERVSQPQRGYYL